jgi:hypothetical protein
MLLFPEGIVGDDWAAFQKAGLLQKMGSAELKAVLSRVSAVSCRSVCAEGRFQSQVSSLTFVVDKWHRDKICSESLGLPPR